MTTVGRIKLSVDSIDENELNERIRQIVREELRSGLVSALHEYDLSGCLQRLPDILRES